MTIAYAKKLGFQTQKTNIGTQKSVDLDGQFTKLS